MWNWAIGSVDVDLFASRLCHQIPRYISWQPRPHSWMVDTFQLNWAHLNACSFPHFALIGWVLAKAMGDKGTLIVITPVWPSQSRYTKLLRMSVQYPIFISSFLNLLTDSNQSQHPSCENQTLALAVWKFSVSALATAFYRRVIRPKNWLAWK